MPINNHFSFKQFSLSQENCAQRITTDSVLLGAWVSLPFKENAKTVIDVGCGCGVLTLMLAQHSPEALYYAVEIDPSAAATAANNASSFVASCRPHCQIKVVRADFNEWWRVTPQASSIDLIISNPPYFKCGLKTSSPAKALARYNDALSLETLMEASAHLLKPEGKIALVTPYDSYRSLCMSAAYHRLSLLRMAEVVTVRGAHPKLLLSEWGVCSKEGIPEKEQIVVREPDGTYSNEYRKLTAEYLLDSAR